ncbi:roadblock/LC7 domain-containing protein [Plantactinospora sp. GCM10030261]|uniref:roadblock/LC7 domain-containing protein n=1 Tax=Plantactinospora sp. GCM10030261 TaxID=3273420 RepID=UPI00360D0261
MDAEATLRGELHLLRRRRSEVSGCVLAGVDGLHIASDLVSVNPEHVAAMAAAGAGLAGRFADTVGHGRLREFTVHGSEGHVVCYPAGWQALLAVITPADTDLSRLHPDARAAAHRLGDLVDSLWPPAPGATAPGMTAPGRLAPASRPTPEPRPPLSLRSPMTGSRNGHDDRRRPPGHP